ncbi:MAG: DNA internalization-related competence protein ComEC/Rec2 [Lachnospiraceae bacterium]|nr:DNA internalization-related competence protein ComEC/Rec2 [Lachnospiraceae bacterium]
MLWLFCLICAGTGTSCLSLAAGAACTALFLIFRFAGRSGRHFSKTVSIILDILKPSQILFAGLVILAGSFWIPRRMRELAPESVLAAARQSQTIQVSGTVRSITKTTYGYQAVLSGCCFADETGESRGFSVRLSGLEEALQPGTYLTAQGEAGRFETARNDGGFDEDAWMRSEDIICQIKKPFIVSARSPESLLYQASWKMRLKLEDVFSKSCPGEEDAGIFLSLLTGDRSQLDPDIKSLWQKAGIAHLLAVSSLHITFAGASAYRIALFLGAPVYLRCAAGAAAASYFCFFTGSSVSALRALIMFLLTMLADLTGRTYDRISALSLSFILITADRCGALYSASLILSYSAVAGIAFLYPCLQRRIYGGRRFWLRQMADSLAAGLSVALSMAPAQALLFYEIPIGSFFINLLILPLSSLLLTSVFLTGAAGAVSIAWGRFFAASGSLLLSLFTRLGGLSLSVPGSVIITGCPGYGMVILYVLFLAAGMLLLCAQSGRKRTAKRKLQRLHGIGVLFLAAAFALILGLWPLPRPDSSPALYMLDVGQGDCLVLRTPDAKVWVVDCGSTSISDAGSGRLASFLKYHKISRIDGIFVSHGDQDHINGVQQILETGDFQIGHLFLSDIGNRSEAEEQAEEKAQNRDIPVTGLARGDVVSGEGYTFAVLSPKAGTEQEDRNEDSLVIRYEEAGFSVLFTGDAGQKTEEEILAEGMESVTVLKTGHHGSESASSSEFLKAAAPEIALISCGVNNRYGHPAPAALARMRQADIRYFITAESGQLTVRHEKGLVVNLKLKES